MKRSLDYICMQPTRQGQASHAHVYEIVAGLRRRGWDVTVVEPSLPRPGRGDAVRRVWAAIAAQFRYWWRRRFRPAPFVYVRGHFFALPTTLLALAAGSVIVLESNGPMDDVFDAWPAFRPLRRLFYIAGVLQRRCATIIISVTPGLEEHWRARTGRAWPYRVIGNGANVDLFSPAAAGPRPARPYAVFTGALASWQGIDTVLEAAESAAWPPGVDLRIAGDGRERERVAEAARRTSHISWLGVIPYAEAPALVATSLLALAPMSPNPRAELGLSPLKLYEAMASGVPVVASDLPDLGDTVRLHDCGIVVPAGDSRALAEAVARIAADPDAAAAMGARGREAAVREYSWDVRAGQTADVLEAAGRDRASRRRKDG